METWREMERGEERERVGSINHLRINSELRVTGQNEMKGAD